ncbi:MAG: NUDIX hydrolase [Methylococcales bacterium]|jgi:8-oxo-dGTP diphosphatase|nr:NUDIX hydrolase [Methylococcales bacterium]MBT7444379.1 NUDIX hydrolase [Methylococcales bacterium]
MPIPKTPLLTADIIIELTDLPDRPIVLIERKNPPHGLALPGGFVDEGEPIEVAAVREAMEEVCLQVELITLLGLYSDPGRDPRGHTVTATYIAQANGTPQAADDAAKVIVTPLDQLPDDLVFDHALMLQDYMHWKATGNVAPLRYIEAK